MPNRRGFLRELDRLIARVSATKTAAAMLFVDLDGLKMINDSFGHRAGDEALIHVADLLAEGIRRERLSWRGSAATNSASCSNMPTRRARTETARAADAMLIGSCEFRHDGDVLAAQRRDRGGDDRAERYAPNRHGPRRRGNVPAQSRAA